MPFFPSFEQIPDRPRPPPAFGSGVGSRQQQQQPPTQLQPTQQQPPTQQVAVPPPATAVGRSPPQLPPPSRGGSSVRQSGSAPASASAAGEAVSAGDTAIWNDAATCVKSIFHTIDCCDQKPVFTKVKHDRLKPFIKRTLGLPLCPELIDETNFELNLKCSKCTGVCTRGKNSKQPPQTIVLIESDETLRAHSDPPVALLRRWAAIYRVFHTLQLEACAQEKIVRFFPALKLGRKTEDFELVDKALNLVLRHINEGPRSLLNAVHTAIFWNRQEGEVHTGTDFYASNHARNTILGVFFASSLFQPPDRMRPEERPPASEMSACEEFEWYASTSYGNG